MSMLAPSRSLPRRAPTPPPSLPPLSPLPPRLPLELIMQQSLNRLVLPLEVFSCCSGLVGAPSPRCAMASSASLQSLGLITLAAILLQIIAVAVSFIYFNKVLNTVSKRVRCSPQAAGPVRRLSSDSWICVLTASCNPFFLFLKNAPLLPDVRKCENFPRKM